MADLPKYPGFEDAKAAAKVLAVTFAAKDFGNVQQIAKCLYVVSGFGLSFKPGEPNSVPTWGNGVADDPVVDIDDEQAVEILAAFEDATSEDSFADDPDAKAGFLTWLALKQLAAWAVKKLIEFAF